MLKWKTINNEFKNPSLFDIFLSRKLLNLIMRDNVTVTKSQKGI